MYPKPGGCSTSQVHDIISAANMRRHSLGWAWRLEALYSHICLGVYIFRNTCVYHFFTCLHTFIHIYIYIKYDHIYMCMYGKDRGHQAAKNEPFLNSHLVTLMPQHWLNLHIALSAFIRAKRMGNMPPRCPHIDHCPTRTKESP